VRSKKLKVLVREGIKKIAWYIILFLYYI
jgi:hypothetical protein